VPFDQLSNAAGLIAAPFGFLALVFCSRSFAFSRIWPLARIASISLGSVIAFSPLILTSELGEILPMRGRVTWFLIVGIGIGDRDLFSAADLHCLHQPVSGGDALTAVFRQCDLPTMFAGRGYRICEVIHRCNRRLPVALVLGCKIAMNKQFGSTAHCNDCKEARSREVNFGLRIGPRICTAASAV